jgi:hypothetical protein
MLGYGMRLVLRPALPGAPACASFWALAELGRLPSLMAAVTSTGAVLCCRIEAAGARVAPKRLPSGRSVGEPRLWLQDAGGPGLLLSRSGRGWVLCCRCGVHAAGQVVHDRPSVASLISLLLALHRSFFYLTCVCVCLQVSG